MEEDKKCSEKSETEEKIVSENDGKLSDDELEKVSGGFLVHPSYYLEKQGKTDA